MARRSLRFRTLIAVAIVGYAAIVAVAPALHHDFQCHVQHPGHCDACRALVAAPGAAGLAPAPSLRPDLSAAVPSRAERSFAEAGRRTAFDRGPPSAV